MRLFTGSLGGSNSGTVIDVVVIAGQSNARGNTNSVAPVSPYITPNANAKILGFNADAPQTINTFEVMDYNAPNFLGDLHAAETSLAYNYNPNEMYIVKVADGGTTLAVDWATGSTNRNQLITSMGLAKTFFTANGKSVRWIFYWNQWETELATTAYVTAYETNYKGLITEIESSVGMTFDKQIIQKVNTTMSFYTSNTVNGDVLLVTQADLVSFYGGNLLDGDDLSHDGGHYYSLSQHALGTRLFNFI